MKKNTTKRLITSAMLIAVSTALAFVCEMIPFLHLPFGGTFTVASMLPIVILSYMYGIKWGTLCGFIYSIIQMVLGNSTVTALFMPGSDSYMLLHRALLVCLIDYIIAYTVIGLGGMFRDRIKSKAASLCLGSIVALSLRYLAHIVSGAIFYGTWAEWFFSQEGFYAFGEKILSTFSGASLSILYSIFYNGLYMIPEIVITAIAAVAVARIPMIKKSELNA